MSTSAANMFNPRLRSNSSENDVEETFLKPGMVRAGTGVGPKYLAKSLSDPMSNGKDKQAGKSSALSDTSNVLKRQPSQTGTDTSSLKSGNGRLERSEEPMSGCDIFPEIETSRERAKDAHSISDILEEDEVNPIGTRGHFLTERAFATVADVLNDGWNNQQSPEEDQEDDIFGIGVDVVFDATGNVSMLQQNATSMFNVNMGPAGEPGVGHPDEDLEDDNSYPEIEQYPAGYGCCGYNEDYSAFAPESQKRPVLRSYEQEFPQIPEDLLKESDGYPDFGKDFELDYVELPESPKMSDEVQARLTLLMGDDY